MRRWANWCGCARSAVAAWRSCPRKHSRTCSPAWPRKCPRCWAWPTRSAPSEAPARRRRPRWKHSWLAGASDWRCCDFPVLSLRSAASHAVTAQSIAKRGIVVVRLLLEKDQVRVPSWVSDLESFRRWADADDFPDKGNIWFLKGEVWVDMSKGQLFTHALVKTETGFGLTGLVKADAMGIYIVDGVLFANEAADLATKPDGIF